MKFDKLGLSPEVLKGIESKGYTNVTPIQAQAIPVILNGRDLLGGAQTGTGKTAAFALPILELLSRSSTESESPRALILTPTRELADQVGDSFSNYGKYLTLKTTKIFGGVKMNPQVKNLKNGTDIVIATPGRLMDHLNQSNIDLSQIELFVLDEADRMLDMGFINDIKKINDLIPQKRQSLLFSATYGNDIKDLAKVILSNPVSIEVSRRNAAAEKVEQILYFVDKKDRFDLLAHLIKEGMWYQVLIFVKTKHGADRLTSQLLKEGIPSSTIHGDKSQGARSRALREFKRGDLQALVATDVAARGIDLDDLSHVVNFELPQIPEDYIHRIGRTGRAGKSGLAISLVSYSEKVQLQKIEKILKSSIPLSVVKGFEPKYSIDKDKGKTKPVGKKDGKRAKSKDSDSSKSKSGTLRSRKNIEDRTERNRSSESRSETKNNNDRKNSRPGSKEGGRRDFSKRKGSESKRSKSGTLRSRKNIEDRTERNRSSESRSGTKFNNDRKNSRPGSKEGGRRDFSKRKGSESKRSKSDSLRNKKSNSTSLAKSNGNNKSGKFKPKKYTSGDKNRGMRRGNTQKTSRTVKRR